MTVKVVTKSLLKAFDSIKVKLQLWGKDHVVISEGLLLKDECVLLRLEFNDVGIDLVEVSFLRRCEDSFTRRGLILECLMSVEILAELMLKGTIFVRNESDWFMFVLLTKGAETLVCKVSKLSKADNCCL